jgi:hypothetical protein
MHSPAHAQQSQTALRSFMIRGDANHLRVRLLCFSIKSRLIVCVSQGIVDFGAVWIDEAGDP